MFVIREVFTAKPGMASQLARRFKEAFAGMPEMHTRVLTDQVASFNTVVLETEVQDLGEFDRRMQEYAAQPEMRERLKGYHDMYLTGRREIYRVMD